MFIAILKTLGQILTAGIAITAFSLLIYSLTFNLRDRVARSFMLILLCISVAFTGEALGTVTTHLELADFWFRFQWLGLIMLPATYFHFSDALLATTGQPSRGRRRLAVRFAYTISGIFILLLPLQLLVGGLQVDGNGLFYLERTPITWVFTFYYAGGFVWAWTNFLRAYQRTVTTTSRRRMRYLLGGALAPALGSFPYLMFGADFASTNQVLFWVLANAATVLVFWFLVSMAYAVAFFGIPWPDRVVKQRLVKWLMRGPVTASLALGLTTIVRRAGESIFDVPDNVFVPFVMVLTILLMEHLVTIFSPLWENYLFGSDTEDIKLLQSLEERVMTSGDMRQFLESVLAASLDQCQSTYGFVAEIGLDGVDTLVTVGHPEVEITTDQEEDIMRIHDRITREEEFSEIKSGYPDVSTQRDYPIQVGGYWILPLRSESDDREEESEGKEKLLLGILGIRRQPDQHLEVEQILALEALGQRATLVLEDRRTQEKVFTSLRALSPQVEEIQRLRAASRYNRMGVLSEPESVPEETDIAQAVKDALSHYWGGPKLTTDPLLQLQVVQKAMDEHGGNPANAVRAILKEAISRVRPQGDRRFTGEWLLYNILELKFLEGRKVREVAQRLSVSEADLYRKQRVAIEAVVKVILEMENEVE